MPDLIAGQRVDLGKGYAIRGPLRGRAERLDAGEPGTRARETVTDTFDDALARNDMHSVATVEITGSRRGPAGTSDLRDSRGDDALLLETPDLGPETGQVVLSVDEAGTVRWNFPLESNGSVQAPSDRGAGGKKRFLIPVYSPPAPSEDEARDRSLFGVIGKKLLKVIVYPITDILIGKTAAQIAEHWESTNRAYGVRDFSVESYRDPAGRALTGADMPKLAEGRALLFVHGTFSTAHGAFADMPPSLMTTLHQRYHGRVFAFNHFSLSHDPVKNVQWLGNHLRDLSADHPLDVDIICHSRGGLVARTLADARGAVTPDQMSVRRIVFVAAPNNGTLLAEPDHMVDMIDRLTSALNLVPPGGIADFLDGLLIAVKIVGHGALSGLDGLQSMNRQGSFMRDLNAHGVPGAEYFGVAANYEPRDPGLKGLVKGTVDAVVDRVFNDDENDLVVPERGVYDGNGSPSFPIPAHRLLRIPATEAVWHTKLFGQRDVVTKIGEWLS